MVFKDPVNEDLKEKADKRGGLAKLGLMNSDVWHDDPKRLVFTLSRYKFVAKLLSGSNSVAEFGCGDGFCSRIVAQHVKELVITDFDPYFISRFSELCSDGWDIRHFAHDLCIKPFNQKFDAIYSLDVVEHIKPELEDILFKNIILSLKDNGICIIGMPSLESQRYASEKSKAGHINCKNGEILKKDLKKYFRNVFLFAMNDEIIHTGFTPMSHYNIALCVTPIRD